MFLACCNLFVETLVEHHETSSSFQTVAAEAEFRHGVYVGHAELDRGAIGSPRQPQVQILTVLSRLQKKDVVAGMKVGQAVEGGVVVVGRLRVEFGVLVGVWKEGM